MESPKEARRIPRVSVYGFGDRRKLRPIVLEGFAATAIEDLESKQPFSELHRGACTLRDQRALYEIGMAVRMGEQLELPDAALDAGRTVYDLCSVPGQANVTDDFCDYGSAVMLRKILPGDIAVRWIVHPTEVVNVEGTWRVRVGPKTEVYHIPLPKTGHVMMTCDGAYRPDTGTPFATVANRDAAIQSWAHGGVAPEHAEREVSFFERRAHPQGLVGVVRAHSVVQNPPGPFCIQAYLPPDFSAIGIGRYRLAPITGPA